MKLNPWITGLDHIGLPTDDLEKTLAFYENLGFTLLHQTQNPETGEKVAFLGLQGVVIETYQCPKAAMINGAVDHLALAVTDIQAVWEALEGKGIQILDDRIQQMPFWEKGVRFFTILGPNHEKIEFLQKL